MGDVEHWTDSRLNAAGALCIDNPHLGDLTTVHPIFHKANFEDITDADYTLIEPSLRLASAYLSEPNTLSFWWSLAFADREYVPRMQRNWQTRDWEDVTERNNLERWSKISVLHHVGRGQLEEINRLFLNMASYICWQFSDRDGGTYRSTVVVPERRPDTHGVTKNFTSIAIIPSFLVELRIVTASTTLPDQNSHLRQVFLLASTLLHELSHGVILAMSDWIENVHEQPAEPFVENDREAEAGYAWEMAMYGGPALAIAYRANCSLGLKACRWPGIKRATIGDHPYMRPSRRNWEIDWALSMAWVQPFFTKLYWEQVERYGLSYMRFPKTLGLVIGARTDEVRRAAASSAWSSHSNRTDVNNQNFLWRGQRQSRPQDRADQPPTKSARASRRGRSMSP
ncbi:MAG: hypothetical protein LQ347_002698 [Umbilicaria vellea]|nr:MAG: hypothetical protein LQ347_002698 [Umbilicaria vellea]